ncbi:MAG TPA: MBL fold metallo-hydrolase [Gemmatimonadaceae bacterium]|nr:MBL fold metallo-hydrolase [Gemmatimonadaceae bacterium]
MHFDGSRFYNASGRTGQPFKKLPKVFTAPRARWPRSVPVRPQRPPALDAACDVAATFIGHSTFLIQSAEGTILTDPVFSRRAGPLGIIGPRRVREPGVRFEDLPRITVVLLSHNHYDHCDLRTLKRLAERFNPLVVTPLGNGDLVRSAGLTRVEELDWWQASRKSEFPVTLAPAQHFSARTPFDRNRALWGSFVFELGGRRLFFAGDTGYNTHFGSIRARLGRMDLSLLPIGAYEPRWFMQDIHMNPAEALQAHLDLDSRTSLAMHFGTFQLTPEGIDEPVRALKTAMAERNVPEAAFRVLSPGESWKAPRSSTAVGATNGAR